MLEQLAERLAAGLEEKGWCVTDDALPEPLVAALANECSKEQASFNAAGVGRQGKYQRDSSVRSDAIRWIDGSLEAGAAYLGVMAAVRTNLNRSLFLGLFDYECHYSRYEPGAFYQRHVDAFKGEKNRVLSTVLYLNRHWRKEEGGELWLYEGEEAVAQVLPHFNRLVVFLSERFPHEVKPATRERHSIAGWFRVRS
jgi:SM-20-related protein